MWIYVAFLLTKAHYSPERVIKMTAQRRMLSQSSAFVQTICIRRCLDVIRWPERAEQRGLEGLEATGWKWA